MLNKNCPGNESLTIALHRSLDFICCLSRGGHKSVTLTVHPVQARKFAFRTLNLLAT